MAPRKKPKQERKVKPKQITFHRKFQMNCGPPAYVEMSALANHQIERPFQILARALLDDPSLEFLGGCATSLDGGPKAPERQVDRSVAWRHEAAVKPT